MTLTFNQFILDAIPRPIALSRPLLASACHAAEPVDTAWCADVASGENNINSRHGTGTECTVHRTFTSNEENEIERSKRIKARENPSHPATYQG